MLVRMISISASLLIMATLVGLAFGAVPDQQLPRYGSLASVPAPDIEAFRQYQTIFFFHVDAAEVNERLEGTGWEALGTPVAMNVSWNFQTLTQFPTTHPETVFGPSSSVVFSFLGRNEEGETRTLAWAIRPTEDSVQRLNDVLGGGNSLGRISVELEDEGNKLKFHGRVSADFGLNMVGKASLPKEIEHELVVRDPSPYKLSFVTWSTDPATVHPPFARADHCYEAKFLAGTTGFKASLDPGGAGLVVPGNHEFHGFAFQDSVYNRMNQFLGIQSASD